VITKDTHERLDRLVSLMEWCDYFSPHNGRREQWLTDQGWSDLLPFTEEIDRIQEQLDAVNKQIGELGYKHRLRIQPFVRVDK